MSALKAICSTRAAFSFAALAFAVGLATAAYGQASINDCEKIQAADAYNQCLAKFGPPAKTLNMEGQRPGDVKTGSEDAAASGGKAAAGGRATARGHRRGRGGFARRGRGGYVARGRSRGGRKRMSISVGR